MRTQSLADGAAYRGAASGISQIETPTVQELSAFRGITAGITASMLIWGLGAVLFWVLH